jgi:hypothetical protein
VSASPRRDGSGGSPATQSPGPRVLRRGRPERAAAWVVTGPLGHLVAGLADWAVLLGRLAWARARRGAGR